MKIQELKLAVFDMAGTTINENNLVYKTLANVLTKNGFDTDVEKVLIHGAGKEKFQAILDILNLDGHSLENADTIYKEFNQDLENSYKIMPIEAFKDAVSTFDFLRENKVKIVLNTGYNRHIANLILDRISWEEGKEFDLLVTADDVEKNRPNPDMILFAMHHFQISNPDNVIKIGDSAVDVMEGKNAGCGLTFGITTGAQTEDHLKKANPNFIIKSLSEILGHLQSEVV